MEESTIATEVREDFQIPPYFSDEALVRLVTEGKAQLEVLNPGADLVNDKVYRQLLKNLTYYAYHHKVNDFFENYASMILSWQLESEVPTIET